MRAEGRNGFLVETARNPERVADVNGNHNPLSPHPIRRARKRPGFLNRGVDQKLGGDGGELDYPLN